MTIIKTTAAKENILRKIRIATQEYKAPKPYSELGKVDFKTLFQNPEQQDLATVFVDAFNAASGKFIYCANPDEFIQQLSALVAEKNWSQVACAQKELFSYLVNKKVPYIRDLDPTNDLYDVCITDCELAIARTGSFIFSSQQNFGRLAPIYYPVHIVVLQPHQLVYDISDGLKVVKQKYQQNLPSMINLNTGPSRTADIEKTLITGVHGPKEIYCFWLES